jgi:hypothetical protein
MSSRLSCPLKNHGDGAVECCESDCAWWNKYGKTCAVLALANAVSLAQKFGLGQKKEWPAREGGDRGGF